MYDCDIIGFNRLEGNISFPLFQKVLEGNKKLEGNIRRIYIEAIHPLFQVCSCERACVTYN
jgi:hypothetical protein